MADGSVVVPEDYAIENLSVVPVRATHIETSGTPQDATYELRDGDTIVHSWSSADKPHLPYSLVPMRASGLKSRSRASRETDLGASWQRRPQPAALPRNSARLPIRLKPHHEPATAAASERLSPRREGRDACHRLGPRCGSRPHRPRRPRNHGRLCAGTTLRTAQTAGTRPRGVRGIPRPKQPVRDGAAGKPAGSRSAGQPSTTQWHRQAQATPTST